MFRAHIHHHLLQKMKNICPLQHGLTVTSTSVSAGELMNIILIWLRSSINSWLRSYARNVHDDLGIQMWITLKIRGCLCLSGQVPDFPQSIQRENDLLWTNQQHKSHKTVLNTSTGDQPELKLCTSLLLSSVWNTHTHTKTIAVGFCCQNKVKLVQEYTQLTVYHRHN